jgi:hypothetical protein
MRIWLVTIGESLPVYGTNERLHYLIDCKFYKYAQEEVKPDIILSSLPILKLSLSAVEYGKKMNIPLVLDMRDMWPDVFLGYIPSCEKEWWHIFKIWELMVMPG